MTDYPPGTLILVDGIGIPVERVRAALAALEHKEATLEAVKARQAAQEEQRLTNPVWPYIVYLKHKNPPGSEWAEPFTNESRGPLRDPFKYFVDLYAKRRPEWEVIRIEQDR